MSDPRNPPPDLLSDAETVQLVKMAATKKGGVSEEHLRRIHEWANGVRIEVGMLALILRGEVVPSVLEDGEILFTLLKHVERDV